MQSFDFTSNSELHFSDRRPVGFSIDGAPVIEHTLPGIVFGLHGAVPVAHSIKISQLNSGGNSLACITPEEAIERVVRGGIAPAGLLEAQVLGSNISGINTPDDPNSEVFRVNHLGTDTVRELFPEFAEFARLAALQRLVQYSGRRVLPLLDNLDPELFEPFLEANGEPGLEAVVSFEAPSPVAESPQEVDANTQKVHQGQAPHADILLTTITPMFVGPNDGAIIEGVKGRFGVVRYKTLEALSLTLGMDWEHKGLDPLLQELGSSARSGISHGTPRPNRLLLNTLTSTGRYKRDVELAFREMLTDNAVVPLH